MDWIKLYRTIAIVGLGLLSLIIGCVIGDFIIKVGGTILSIVVLVLILVFCGFIVYKRIV